MKINLTTLPKPHDVIEIVERKGRGHPDTLCDDLAEQLSIALSRYYLDQFGLILHHNVDKVLLRAGMSRPAFGGGEVIAPIDIYFAGRATDCFRGKKIPVEEIVIESARNWIENNFHQLDLQRHVRLHNLIHPGSSELVELFLRQRERGIALANDTSCGVGYAPLSPLEKRVLGTEKHMNSALFKRQFPEIGEDIKIMGLRDESGVHLTVASAFVDRYIQDIDDYRGKREWLRQTVSDFTLGLSDNPITIDINAGDDIEQGSIYLTVTGTSGESGDDGQVGRGNRINGLISPLRPMNMEAAAGKNPITHVGKLYNIMAFRVAEDIYSVIEGANNVECFLVSQIGSPITQPQLVKISIHTIDDRPLQDFQNQIDSIVGENLADIGNLWRDITAQRITVC